MVRHAARRRCVPPPGLRCILPTIRGDSMQIRAGLAIAASVLVAGSLFFKDAPLSADRQGGASGPTYQVDPLWPKPLPNHWILGSVTGLAVDSQDHIWLVHH